MNSTSKPHSGWVRIFFSLEVIQQQVLTTKRLEWKEKRWEIYFRVKYQSQCQSSNCFFQGSSLYQILRLILKLRFLFYCVKTNDGWQEKSEKITWAALLWPDITIRFSDPDPDNVSMSVVYEEEKIEKKVTSRRVTETREKDCQVSSKGMRSRSTFCQIEFSCW